MDLVVVFVKFYVFALLFILIVYALRHYLFTLNRAIGKQRIGLQEIIDSELPNVSVLIPMHNEEKVAKDILSLLTMSAYPKEKLEIIPIDDHSTDRTQEILRQFEKEYPFIKPLIRRNGKRGKPISLNDALRLANGDIVVVFDADYLPGKGLIRELVINFIDPEVGAVMGRVIPLNISKNILTRILDLERIGGYQVDQQARYNLKLIPQYGGTVGAFRKDLVIQSGGFEEHILAEDTELTYRLYLEGYKVVYANRAECFEEVPERWDVRARQIRRWSCGHNQVMFKYFLKTLTSKKLSLREKIDGVLLLMVYLVPFLTIIGIPSSLLLFFKGEYIAFLLSNVIFISFSQSFGNFAPFFEIGMGAFLDGVKERILLLPLLTFNFFFDMYYASLGFIDAIMQIVTGKHKEWDKTRRFRE